MGNEDTRTREVTLERALGTLRDISRKLDAVSEITAALAGRYDEPVVSDALEIVTDVLVDVMEEALDVLDAAGFPRR